MLVMVFCWNQFIPRPEYVSNAGYGILAFLFLFSILLHSLLSKSLGSENKNDFSYKFMGLTGMKMFASLIGIVILAMIFKTKVMAIGLQFLILYLAYTIFETVLLMKLVKQDKANEKNQ